MIYIKYLLSVAAYLAALPTTIFMPFIVAAFTRYQEIKPDGELYNWGWIWGTFDNPPQGDRGFIRERSPFPNVFTGWRGYINRVQWMRRNRLYNLKKWLAIDYSRCVSRETYGNPDISDKYKVSGWMFMLAKCNQRKTVAFEFYAVLPWAKTRNLRIRLGWKIKSDKFDGELGFAPLVFTINPLDTYGD